MGRLPTSIPDGPPLLLLVVSTRALVIRRNINVLIFDLFVSTKTPDQSFSASGQLCNVARTSSVTLSWEEPSVALALVP